jgi:carboxyl-terminal processing protease
MLSMNGKQRIRRKRRTLAATVVMVFFAFVSLGFLVEGSETDFFLRVYRGIDTFTKVYKEVALNYVDEIEPERLMRSGIDGMLKTLDPYTVYIGEKENDEIDLVTTGKYGGIGVTIGLRDGAVTVINLLEGFSAAKQGIEVGDRIIEINGKPLKGKSLEDVRLLVRGVPGTEVKMRIEREGEKKPLDFVLVREEISIRNVTYTGYVGKGIGYIRLERFSRTAGDDVRSAIKDLRAQGELKAVVLDLRDNPGGLLESAVDVVSKFVPDSSLVVSTRGRKIDSERKYYSEETPMLRDVPLAVLVNRLSASASEIVAGAVQDLDRGIIAGTRTFGKGLVQTITRLSETSSLKMTTARYYTPSGRCIQEIDYWHRGPDGNETVIPDSLRKEYHTAHKRPVWEGGGIRPDTTVTDTLHNPFIDELYRKAMFFKYANHYAAEKKTLDSNFEVTDAMIGDFEAFLKQKGFEYQDEGEAKLKELREIATTSRYDKSFFDGVGKLESILKAEEGREVHRYQEDVRTALRTEILGRMKGDKAQIESTFPSDVQLQTAIRILENKKVYNKLLGIKGK